MLQEYKFFRSGIRKPFLYVYIVSAQENEIKLATAKKWNHPQATAAIHNKGQKQANSQGVEIKQEDCRKKSTTMELKVSAW